MSLPYDPATAVRLLSDADPVLGQLMDRVGPYRLELRVLTSPFEALTRAIVYQQLSGKAAATIFGRLEALCPQQTPTPAALLALPDEALRGAGLSRAKTAAVKDLAEKSLAGLVPPLAELEAMSDQAIIERLVQVRGIGPWTVQMLLLFRLGRPDVLPSNDLGIRKGFMYTYGHDEMPTPAEVVAQGARWAPFRSVASWYLWRAVDLAG